MIDAAPSTDTPVDPTQIDAISKFLNEGNMIHAASDLFFQPNRQVAAKINRKWQPHPCVSDYLTDIEFMVFLRQALSVDAEYPLPESLLENLVQQKLTPEDEQLLAQKRDFAFYATLEGTQYRIRGHLGQDYNGPCMDVRILKSKVELPDQLGFPVELADKILDRNRGLILVNGKTGSGKSTTVAALAYAFSQRYPGSKILTLEDPVEYVMSFPNAVISQKQVRVHVDNWTQGVFHAKREQPDLLIVGEMRDPETVRAVIDAASSGMLVITTAHADRYDRALDFLIEAYSQEKQAMVGRRLAYILRGIVVQQLIPSAERGKISEGGYTLPSLGYDIFLNEGTPIQSAIQKLDWSSLAVNESNSYYSFKRRLGDLVAAEAVTKAEAENVMQQYRA